MSTMAAPTAVSSATTTATMTRDLPPTAKASGIGTPLSATYPSELRSPMLQSPRYGQPGIKQENGSIKTPITPPSAYVDFLKQFSPSLYSPLSTGASSSFSFSRPSPLGGNFGGKTPSSATFARPQSATFSRPLSASIVRPPLSSNPSTNSNVSNSSAASCASATSAASNISGCSSATTSTSPDSLTATSRDGKLSGTGDAVAASSSTETTTSHPVTNPTNNASAASTAAPATLAASTALPTATANSSKPLSRPLPSPSPYPYPSQIPRRSSSSTSGVLRPTLRIPQSPMFTPGMMCSPASGSSSITTSTPHSIIMSSPIDWEANTGERKKGSVHVRQVVTRTITYSRTPVTPLEPAPKGKRRKLEADGPEGEADAEQK